MASPETNLLTALQSASAVTALVAARIRFDRAHEGDAIPFVVLGREETGPQATLSQAIDNPDVFFNVHCWADSRQAAEALADACRTALHEAGVYTLERTAAYSDEVALHAAILKVVLD